MLTVEYYARMPSHLVQELNVGAVCYHVASVYKWDSMPSLTLMLLVTNLANKNYAKKLKMTETLAHGYSLESTQRELSNGYQHNRV